MRCCRKRLDALLLGVLLLLAAQLASAAAEISVRAPELVTGSDDVTVSADFNINFNSRLEDVVDHGVVLYFVVDFELLRSRWYWFDEQIVRRSRTYRFSYHALTRQYRLSTGVLHQNFASLDEALQVLGRLRNWQVLDRNEIKAGETYLAGLRLRLDLSQMPKTFQVSALANRDWSLASDWVYWEYTPLAPLENPLQAPAAAPATPAGDGQ
ncbi:MAG: DUF4390 domain-containing protein [Propionivibrio sp.]